MPELVGVFSFPAVCALPTEKAVQGDSPDLSPTTPLVTPPAWAAAPQVVPGHIYDNEFDSNLLLSLSYGIHMIV